MMRVVGLAGLAVGILGLGSMALAQQPAGTVPTSALMAPSVVPPGTVAVVGPQASDLAPTELPRPAPFKPAPRGTYLETTDAKRTVHFVNGYDVSFDTGDSRWDGTTALITDGLGGTPYPPGRAAALWPLAVGRSTAFNIDAGGGPRHVTARVLKTETIAVTAGRFHTYVIERRTRSYGDDNAEVVATYWYAPSVGAMVKFEERVTRGATRPRSPWELAAIVLPQPLDGTLPVAVPGDSPDNRAAFCRERGTTVRLPDGRPLHLSCLTYVQAELIPYRDWLQSRGALGSARN